VNASLTDALAGPVPVPPGEQPDQQPAPVDLVAIAGRTAEQADRTGVLAPEVVAALIAARVSGHFVPARWNGREGTFGELTRAMVDLGTACASASWVGSMSAYTGRFATHLPLAAQEEIWADDPDVPWASGLVPAGRSRRTDHGYRLSGSWNYVSGCEFAGWLLLAGPGPAPDSGPPLFHAVPRGAFTIERTWDAVGMRATGTHTVVLDDVEVPFHRTVPVRDVALGRNATSTVIQHNVPLPSLGGLTCVAPTLGAARAALAGALATTGRRREALPVEARVGFDDAVTHASADLDAVTLVVDRIIDVLDSGRAGELALRNARDAAWSARVLRDAVQRLLLVGGTSAQNRFGSLDRSWRDVLTGTSHAALRFDKVATAYGEAATARAAG